MTRFKTRVLLIAATSTVLVGGPLAAGANAVVRYPFTYPNAPTYWTASATSRVAPDPAPTPAQTPAPPPTATSASLVQSPTTLSGGTSTATSSTTSTTPATAVDQPNLLPSTRQYTGTAGFLGDPGVATSLRDVAVAVNSNGAALRGYSGRNVGVALIDTGVVPVQGLTGGHVVNGVDLSFESQNGALRHLDTYGHGTHMAGIIASNERLFRGVAPEVRLTSVKVAGADGAVDVSQVIAAVDWVVAHRNDDPANPIRVLNLSYGTDGVQDYQTDPLTHAVENAWRAGIVVVVAAGNNGTTSSKLNNPAYDPFVLAVGAADIGAASSGSDDTLLDFSSRGDASRRVDLVAPGRSIVSLRSPGSALDEANASARVESRFFKGSGTSQAAAVVSGAVALLLQAKPTLKPDQVKALLKQSASPLAAGAAGGGAGLLNVEAAIEQASAAVPLSPQGHPRSTGLGSLEQARGSQHVADAGVELRGERHILGPFDAKTWARDSANFRAWHGGTWGGAEWVGTCRCDTSALGPVWQGRTWAGESWAGRTWAGRSWTGRTWTGVTWAGHTWAGRTWAGRTWTGGVWT